VREYRNRDKWLGTVDNVIAILAMILLGVDTISRSRCFPDHAVWHDTSALLADRCRPYHFAIAYSVSTTEKTSILV
jgi:hypothetical protein